MKKDNCLISAARIAKCTPGARCTGCGWNRSVEKRITRAMRYEGLKRDKKGLYRIRMEKAILRGEY